MGVINTNVNKLIIGFFLLSSDVGNFSVAQLLASGLLIIPQTIGLISYPMLVEFHTQKLYKTLNLFLVQSMKYTLIILSICGLQMILFSKEILTVLLKPEFSPAIIPSNILIIGIILSGPWVAIGSTFSGIGRADINWKIGIVTIIIGVTLNCILVPIMGISGAAIAVVCSSISDLIISSVMLKKLLNIEIKRLIILFIKIPICIGIICILLYALEGKISSYILGPLILFIYIFLLIASRAVAAKDIGEITMILRYSLRG